MSGAGRTGGCLVVPIGLDLHARRAGLSRSPKETKSTVSPIAPITARLAPPYHPDQLQSPIGLQVEQLIRHRLSHLLAPTPRPVPSEISCAMAATFPRGAAKALATVTTPSKGIYLLSMANLPDNRLTPVSSTPRRYPER